MKKTYSSVYALFAITVLMSTTLVGCERGGDDDRPVNRNTPATVVHTQTVSTVSGSSTGQVVNNATYKDNTYSESTSYEAPSGTEDVTFKFTLKGGVVTDVALTSTAASGTSGRYQQMFMSGLNDLVVGKPLNSIGTFDRVNGASLTAGAFNDAIAKLKADAKA